MKAVAGWCLALGIIAVIVGVITLVSENNQVKEQNAAFEDEASEANMQGAFREMLSDDPFYTYDDVEADVVEPDRTVSYLAFGAGAVLLIVAAILWSSPQASKPPAEPWYPKPDSNA